MGLPVSWLGSGSGPLLQDTPSAELTKPSVQRVEFLCNSGPRLRLESGPLRGVLLCERSPGGSGYPGSWEAMPIRALSLDDREANVVSIFENILNESAKRRHVGVHWDLFKRLRHNICELFPPVFVVFVSLLDIATI